LNSLAVGSLVKYNFVDSVEQADSSHDRVVDLMIHYQMPIQKRRNLYVRLMDPSTRQMIHEYKIVASAAKTKDHVTVEKPKSQFYVEIAVRSWFKKRVIYRVSISVDVYLTIYSRVHCAVTA
jgi:hypothetical protein